MSKHTPAPWSFERETQSYGDYDEHLWKVFKVRGGFSAFEIARIDGINDEANARLIAAAPELLEVCMAALPSLKELLTGSSAVHGRRCKCVADIEAAIAKATGEEVPRG